MGLGNPVAMLAAQRVLMGTPADTVLFSHIDTAIVF
jgi:hypothetical protein